MKRLLSLFLLLSCVTGTYWVKGQSCPTISAVVDSSFHGCSKNVQLWCYIQPPSFPSSFTVYWGDGSSNDYQFSLNQYFLSVTHTYSQGGFYAPYIIMTSPCLDTFAVSHYTSGMNHQFIVIKDSCYKVSGKAYVDIDNNCNYTNGDHALRSHTVHAIQNGIIVDVGYTDAWGNYEVFVGQGSYDLEFFVYNQAISPACNASFHPTNLSGPNYDFIAGCQASDLEAFVSNGSYSPVFYRPIYYEIKNHSCFATANIIGKLVLDSRLNYNGSFSNNMNITPTQAGDTLFFVVPHIPPFGSFHGYVYVIGDSTLTLNDSICVSWHSSAAPGETYLVNNQAADCSPVNTSYDPNMKEVAINGMPAEGFIAPNQTMTYTIHFQNNGNAPALNVRITDTLSNNLDYTSFRYIHSSHPVQIYQDKDKLTFYFANIMLPDSASDPNGSRGFVQFEVKQKPNLAPGTVIPNSASIYFDYNAPIVTNTVISTIRITTYTSDSQFNSFKIYPNPTRNVIHILTQEKNYVVKLMNLQGQVLLENGNNNQLSVEHLPNGIYLLQLEGSQGQKVSYRIIKE